MRRNNDSFYISMANVYFHADVLNHDAFLLQGMNRSLSRSLYCRYSILALFDMLAVVEVICLLAL